jgi:hypothetical protein
MDMDRKLRSLALTPAWLSRWDTVTTGTPAETEGPRRQADDRR